MPKPKAKPGPADHIAKLLPAGIGVAANPDGTIGISINVGAAPDRLRSLGGSGNPAANYHLASEVLAMLPPSRDLDSVALRLAGTLALLAEMAPADGVEGMICVQAVALHMLGMEAARRAHLDKQPADVGARLRKDAANMMRGTADMLAALDRKRGKGQQQHIRVERVLVTEGGAVIGQGAAPLALERVEAVAVARGGRE